MKIAFYRVSWRFFWHGYIYKSKDLKSMDEVKNLIQELRKNEGFTNKNIRVQTYMES